MSTETVTIEVPAHLKKWFISVFSDGVEQTFMEAYADAPEAQRDFVGFRYPYFRQEGEGCDIRLVEYED